MVCTLTKPTAQLGSPGIGYLEEILFLRDYVASFSQDIYGLRNSNVHEVVRLVVGKRDNQLSALEVAHW